MKRTVLLFTFALLVLGRGADAADYGFGFNFPTTGIFGAPGSTVTVEGFATFSCGNFGPCDAASGDCDAAAGFPPCFPGQFDPPELRRTCDDGPVGFTMSWTAIGGAGVDFCLDPGPVQRPPVLKQQIIQAQSDDNGDPHQAKLFIFAGPTPVDFVVQNAVDGCAGGGGDPDHAQNRGRRGYVATTIFEAGNYLTPTASVDVIRVNFEVTIPAEESTFSLVYEGVDQGVGDPGIPAQDPANRLQGPGANPVGNGVNIGVSTAIPSFTNITFTVGPAPFFYDMVVECGDVNAIAGNAGSADGTISIECDDANMGEGIAATAFSLSLSDNAVVDIESANTSQDLVDALSGVSGSLAFDAFAISGNGSLDAAELYVDEGDPDCADGADRDGNGPTLSDGAAQGAGLTVGQVFAFDLTGSGDTLSPTIDVVCVEFTVGGDFPDDSNDGASFDLTLVDCLRGPGAQIKNSATLLGRTIKPRNATGDAGNAVNVSVSDSYVPCDPNNDQKTDIADIVWLLSELMAPEGRGTGAAAGCQDSRDCDGEGGVGDIADIMFAVEYQFDGGSPPPDGLVCFADPDSTPESCPSDSTGCP
jgi:hypothetical protein